MGEKSIFKDAFSTSKDVDDNDDEVNDMHDFFIPFFCMNFCGKTLHKKEQSWNKQELQFTINDDTII